MARKYYTLCTFDAAEYGEAAWHDQFGDYSRSAVQDEADDTDIPARHKAIISTDGTAAALIAKLAELNAAPMATAYNAKGRAKRDALKAKLAGKRV